MSVFLRWGVFGILAVAAMVYAYNASKRMAEVRQAQPAPVVEEPLAEEVEEAEAESPVASTEEPVQPEVPAICQEEQEVVERALKMRRDGEPLDRLLRIQLIAFQADPLRRERLQVVARKWFEREGRDPNAATLRREALRDCQAANRAP